MGPPGMSAARIAQIRDGGPPVMREAAQNIDGAPYTAGTKPTTFAPTKLAVTNPRLYREVFGFAFANSLGDPNIGYPSWNMRLLSTVAYFGIHVDWTGGFSSGSGLTIWNDPNGPVPGLISTAHANGTKVVLTIELFDSASGTINMCSALDRADVTIQNTVAEVIAKGIDGVNIDYESNNTTCNDPGFPLRSSQSLFTAFVAHMRSALPAGSYLSVDTYSGAAGYRDSTGAYLGFFDIGALANYVDSFFVMAYDMEYDNSFQPPLNCSTYCLGPTAPLSTYYWNDTRASNEYSAVVAPSKVIMGIPYYGRKECLSGYTPYNAPANAPLPSGGHWTADGYLDATGESTFSNNSQYVRHRDAVDTQGGTAWDTWSSPYEGCNREMYYDDVTSLGNKYNLVINNHLRGIGIFALNYGGGAPELWSLILTKFGQCSQAALTADHTSPQIPGAHITVTGSALCAGTATYRFWVEAPGASSFTVVQDYSTSPVLNWDSTGKAMGTYTFQVDARNQGSSVVRDSYARMSFGLGPCVTPTVTTSPGSPQLAGTTVTLSASAPGCAHPLYQFWILRPGSSSWQIVQPYSTNATFSWNTSLPLGDYLYTVWVRDAGGSGTFCSSLGCNDGYFPGTVFTLISQPCTSVNDSPSPSSPSLSATAVTFTATASGCPHPLYQFWLLRPGSQWQVVQAYSSSPTFNWNTTGLPAGGYLYTVWARDVSSPGTSCGSLGCSDAFVAAPTYTLTVQPCTSVTDSAGMASPQLSGTTVTFTGSASGCPHPLYQFWILPAGSHTWQVAQPYSSSATLNWNTSGLAAGSYLYTVWARDTSSQGSSCSSLGCNDAYFSAAAFALTTQPCPSVTDSAAPASPQSSGSVITFTAAASGCPHPLYEFWVLAPGSQTWQILQPYSSTATASWNTTGLLRGSYLYTVWARDASSPGTSCGSLGCLDTYNPAAAYSLTSQPCTSVSDSAAPGSPQVSGTTVTFTASASGCAHPLYQFWLLAPGSHTWQILQPYSSAATATWNTSAMASGNYLYTVWARDVSSAGTSCGSLGCDDVYYPAAGYSLT